MQRYLLLSTLMLGLLAACQSTPSTPNPMPSASNPASSLQVIKTIPVGKSPHGMSAAQGFIYNSNSAENTISVIDSATDNVVKTVTLAEGNPNYTKALHNGKFVAVLNTAANQIHLLDPARGHDVVQSLTLGKGPDKVVFSEDDRSAFVSLTGQAEAQSISLDPSHSAAPLTLKNWPTGAGAADGKGHRSLAFADGWLVVPNPGDNDVSLINLASNEQMRLQDGNNPGPVAIGTQDGKATAVLVGNAASNTITLFKLPGGEKTTLSDVGLSPTDVAIVPELGRAFVTMAGSDHVAVVDYVNQRLVGKVSTGKRPVHIYAVPALNEMSVQHEGHDHDSASSELWVGNDSGDSVTIIDAQSLAVKATVPVGKGHHKMAFSGDKGYVSNISENTVSVILRK